VGEQDVRDGYPFTFDGESADGLTIALRLADKMGRADLQPLILNEAKDETQEISLDGSEAAELFGQWRRTDLEAGLAETVEWLKGYLAEGGER
jgi:nucleoside-diphosphate-sugar epimerase